MNSFLNKTWWCGSFSIGTGMIARSCADAAMLAAKKSRKIQAIFMCAFS